MAAKMLVSVIMPLALFDMAAALTMEKYRTVDDSGDPFKCKGWCTLYSTEKACGWKNCKACDRCETTTTTTTTPCLGSGSGTSTTSTKPNIVFFLIDDYNVDTYDPDVSTAALDRIAASGTNFSHAYANHPICAPSRSSMLTGILGKTSSNLFFDEWYENPVLSQSKTIMEHLKANGYQTHGTGKFLHHDNSEVPGAYWDDFGIETSYGPYVFNRTNYQWIAHPDLPSRMWDMTFSRYRSYVGINFGKYDADLPKDCTLKDDLTKKRVRPNKGDKLRDEQSADWAVEKIERITEEYKSSGTIDPFFIAVGIIRPHTPLYCPGKYWDMVPSVDQTPLHFEPNCTAECSQSGLWTSATQSEHKGTQYYRALRDAYANPEQGLKEFTHAYRACKAFAMDQMNRILDALEESPFADNTIIIATGDNGWQDGQHQYIYKNMVWEESAHVPLVIKAPGVSIAGSVVDQPVTLVDIYPTIVELCGLAGDTRKSEAGASLDGHSLVPLLKGETESWTGPNGAASMSYAEYTQFELPADCHTDYRCHHWSVRVKGFRYILFNTGAEELYQYYSELDEKTNLAYSDNMTEIVQWMRTELHQATGINVSELGKQTNTQVPPGEGSGTPDEDPNDVDVQG